MLACDRCMGLVKPIDFLWLKKKICTFSNSEKGKPFLLMEDEFSLTGNALNADKTMESFLFFPGKLQW